MESLVLFTFVLDIISTVLLFAAAYYVYSINFRSEKLRHTWGLIGLGFLLSIFSRLVQLSADVVLDPVLRTTADNIIVPIIRLAIAGLFAAGFSQLYLNIRKIGV